MNVIEVVGLHKHFGRGDRTVEAVAGLDLEVPAGGVFGFLGPNGSGKTTTIRCLLSLTRPTAGVLRVFGVDPWRHFAQVQRRVGAMTEGQALFPGFSGRRNLELFAALYGLPTPRIAEVLELVELGDRADDEVRTYSLGMRQRLALAAALLKEPELLILDEPANGLDPAGIRDVRTLLRRLAAEGRTVFVSSHQLAEVQQLCDRVAIIARGRCVTAGSVEDVLARAGATGVVVRLDDLAAGAAVLQARGLRVKVDGEYLRVDVPVADASQVAEILGTHGLWVRELRPRVTLEEAFLSLTEPPS